MKKLLLLLAIGSFSTLLRSDGALDTTFGTSGYITVPSTMFVNGIVKQISGRFVVAGTDPQGFFQVIRYLSDGSLDTTFGANGVALSASGIAFDVFVDQSGYTVIGGQDTAGNFQLVRYTPTGSIDFNFGFSGTVVGPSGLCTCLALQTDSKIIAAGVDNSGNFTVIRYTSSGSVDTAFDTGPSGFIEDIKIDSDGSVIAVGTDQSFNTQLVRYNSDGTLDTSFGSSGVATGPLGVATCVAIQPDGKYLVAGYEFSSPNNMQLMRFNNNGTLDTGFGTSGIADLTEGIANDIALQSDGKIVLIGHDDTNALIVRYGTTGTLDISFGINGVTTAAAGAFHSISIQADGPLLAVGLDSTSTNVLIGRFTNTQALTTVQITGPLTTSAGMITFEGIAQSPSFVYFFLNGTLLGGTTTIGSTNDWEFETTISNRGLYLANAIAIYPNGNINTSNTKQIRVI